MIFESKYRRQALQTWASSNEKTKKEMLQVIHKKYQITRNLFKKFISFIASMWKHSKSTH
jgi:hypothetical protein